MGRKVVLDQECCTGCGSCAELCPDVFELVCIFSNDWTEPDKF